MHQKTTLFPELESIFDGTCYAGRRFKIYYVNASRIGEFVPSDSVQVIVTSPPYADLRDYGIPGQIGLDQDYGDYLADLDTVWSACFRVLKPSGTFWLNIGHQMVNGELRNIGTDLFLHCQKIGFKLRRIFYWFKRNYASGYNKRDLLLNFEPIYCFAKDLNQTYFNEDAAKFGDFTSPDVAYSFWRIVRKGGSLKIAKSGSRDKKGPTKDQNNPHPAPFPDELVDRVVCVASKEGDVVLDPFLGSGTTTKIAVSLKRNGVGFEINPDFYRLNKCRMELNDDYSSIQDWVEKFDQGRRLKHETQKMKNR